MGVVCFRSRTPGVAFVREPGSEAEERRAEHAEDPVGRQHVGRHGQRHPARAHDHAEEQVEDERERQRGDGEHGLPQHLHELEAGFQEIDVEASGGGQAMGVASLHRSARAGRCRPRRSCRALLPVPRQREKRLFEPRGHDREIR